MDDYWNGDSGWPPICPPSCYPEWLGSSGDADWFAWEDEFKDN